MQNNRFHLKEHTRHNSTEFSIKEHRVAKGKGDREVGDIITSCNLMIGAQHISTGKQAKGREQGWVSFRNEYAESGSKLQGNKFSTSVSTQKIR